MRIQFCSGVRISICVHFTNSLGKLLSRGMVRVRYRVKIWDEVIIRGKSA